ncbi:Tetratricopeptide repeat protein 17 [Armadillidium vulgare]|nr:Tetratricopeptide repeat protein 17 [Armadillidium vulgare]
MNCTYIFFIILSFFILSINSTTHWFLNNEGKIQAQMDSIYQLRRPYDFLALIQQEERAKHVEQLKKELLEQKAHIDKNEDKLEERIYRTYTDCILAGRPLTEFDLYSSSTFDLKSIGINIEEHVNFEAPVNSENLQTPDCQSFTELPFSMFLLEHLKGMRFRENLTALPEEETPLNDEQDPNIWGHRVSEGLSKNKTSWVLYTLASQYWRIKGNTQEAVECIRRAIYFSTREYRYVVLFHLGNILHRSHESEDAAIVLHMALDHYKRSAAIHEILGCVYATVGYYNESVLCLENALHISSKDENLKKLKHAVLCHAHLESALEKQLQSLQHTLNELRAYQKKHDEWLNLQQKLLLEQATPEMKLESRLEYEEQKIRESADGRGQDCFQYQQDGHTFLSCNMRRDQLEHQGSSTELLLDLQSLLHTVESETMRLGQQVLKRKPNLPSSVPYVTPLVSSSRGRPKMPQLESSKTVESFSSTKDCDQNLRMPLWDSFPTVFLPSENKGLSVDDLFQDIDVVFDEDLSPICETLPTLVEEVDSIPGIRERENLISTQPDFQAVPALSNYGLHLFDLETDMKLASAIKQEEQPSRWVFLNLAGLYWRINGNLVNGVECLRQAVHETPKEYLDLPLVNLASLLYKGGHIDDSLHIALKALQINSTEVETNFLLGNLYFGKGNLTGALHHYENVLTSSPNHLEAQQYFNVLSCHMKKPKKHLTHPTCSNTQKNHIGKKKNLIMYPNSNSINRILLCFIFFCWLNIF